MAAMQEARKSSNNLSDSDSDDDSSVSHSSASDDSDSQLCPPVKKRTWLANSSQTNPAETDAPPASGSHVSSSRAAAGEAWRRAFQEGAIDSQLSRAVGFVSGGVPNIDRDTEAYNYKLAPRLPNKQARLAKRKADLAAISAAVAADADEYSTRQLELEEFGVPNPNALPPTDAQIDLRQQLEAKKRKRNRDKRLARQRKRAESVRSGETADADAAAAGGAMEVDTRKRSKQEKRHRNRDGLNPSHSVEKLSRRLASLLQEPKRHLLERVINLLGANKAIELYRRTQDVESAGGLLVANGNRRRSPGGVYLQLLKSDDSVTPEIIRSVFDGELNLSKEKRKLLRARRRRHKPRTGVEDSDAALAAAPAADSEAAELEAKRAELLAQLDALEDAD